MSNVSVRVKEEDLEIVGIISKTDKNGIYLISKGDGDFEFGVRYFIPFYNISWIKYPSDESKDDEEYIKN